MFCKKCGEQIAEDAQYCPKCGQAVNEPVAQESAPQESKPAEATQGCLQGVSLIVAIIAIIVGIVAYMTTCS